MYRSAVNSFNVLNFILTICHARSKIISGFSLVPDVTRESYNISITQNELESAQNKQDDYKIDYYLITHQTPTYGLPLIVGDVSSLQNSSLNPQNPTRILVHGWLGNRHKYDNNLIPVYRKKGDYNIIVVDWSDAAETYDYLAARKRIGKVGVKIAQLLDFLIVHGQIPAQSIYLIGHSLGAHLVGVAARNMKSGRVGVIVALDAAAPLFLPTHKDFLTSTVADYVLSLHTNGFFKGIFPPIGHASFYPNWGKAQPGCGLDLLYSCSHNRVVDYFVESLLRRNSFVSNKCSDFQEILSERCKMSGERAYMGGDPVNISYKGIYYVKINPNEPFGTGRG